MWYMILQRAYVQSIDAQSRRGTKAAKRFLRKVLAGTRNPHPRVINVDKNPAYPAAVKALKEEGPLRRRCRLRQCNEVVPVQRTGVFLATSPFPR